MSANNLDQPILAKDVTLPATDNTAKLSASGNGTDAISTLQASRDSVPGTAQQHLPGLDIIGHHDPGAGSESSGIYTNHKQGLTFQQEDFADGTHRALLHTKEGTMVSSWDDQHNMKSVLYDDKTGKALWSMDGSSDGSLDSKSYDPGSGKVVFEEIRYSDGSWGAGAPGSGSGPGSGVSSGDGAAPGDPNAGNPDPGSEGTAAGAKHNLTWENLEAYGGPAGDNPGIENSDPGLQDSNGLNSDHRSGAVPPGQAGQAGAEFRNDQTAGSGGKSNPNN